MSASPTIPRSNKLIKRPGRPSAPEFIVEIKAAASDLPDLSLNHRDLVTLTASNIDCIRWMAEHNLIANTLNCPTCEIPMKFQRREGVTFVDGFAWACSRCRTQRSIRVNSFFEGSHLSLSQLLDIIYWWSKDMRQCEVLDEIGVTAKTLVDWQNYICDICAFYIMDHPVQLGGAGRTVEIDESKFTHRKYRKNAFRDGTWVLGMIESETDRCILLPVKDRSVSNLLPLIRQHVLPGTRIVTDQWEAYNQFANSNSIDHSLHFVDPSEQQTSHTKQTGCWAHAKAKYRSMHGTSNELFFSYLHEFMWKKQFKTNRFGNILYWIAFYYPV